MSTTYWSCSHCPRARSHGDEHQHDADEQQRADDAEHERPAPRRGTGGAGTGSAGPTPSCVEPRHSFVCAKMGGCACSRLAALLAVPALALCLAGCAHHEAPRRARTRSAPTPPTGCAPSGPISEAVEVTGDFGTEPTVDVQRPVSTSRPLQRTVIDRGRRRRACRTAPRCRSTSRSTTARPATSSTRTGVRRGRTLFQANVDEAALLPGLVKTLRCAHRRLAHRQRRRRRRTRSATRQRAAGRRSRASPSSSSSTSSSVLDAADDPAAARRLARGRVSGRRRPADRHDPGCRPARRPEDRHRDHGRRRRRQPATPSPCSTRASTGRAARCSTRAAAAVPTGFTRRRRRRVPARRWSARRSARAVVVHPAGLRATARSRRAPRWDRPDDTSCS